MVSVGNRDEKAWNRIDELLKQLSRESSRKKVRTTMLCRSCFHHDVWEGDYLGKTFDCPSCHAQNAFEGRYYLDGDSPIFQPASRKKQRSDRRRQVIKTFLQTM